MIKEILGNEVNDKSDDSYLSKLRLDLCFRHLTY